MTKVPSGSEKYRCRTSVGTAESEFIAAIEATRVAQASAAAIACLLAQVDPLRLSDCCEFTALALVDGGWPQNAGWGPTVDSAGIDSIVHFQAALRDA